MKEPLWRTLLCWGSVLIFLGAPVGLLTLQICDHLQPRDLEAAKSMSPMYFAISGVVASLAGLGTWQNIRNGKPGSGTS
jgi:hypothetical protein